MADVSADDHDSLQETLVILSDADTVAAIRAGIAGSDAGGTESADEVRAAMVRARRLAE